MPHLLLELFSEEIPARMQAKAAEDLRSLITNGLVEAGLLYEGAQAHAGPRRLVLAIDGLQAQAKDVREERKGPRVDAPQAAIDGFLKSTGLTLAQLTKQDDKKGQVYIAVIEKKGRAATEIIAELVPQIIRNFPWPKSMRWGSGSLRWVRPLHSILCTFDGEVVPFEVDGIKSGSFTKGHRFLAPSFIYAKRFEDYSDMLLKARVIVDATVRAETIRTEAKNLAFAQGLELVEDDALVKEVAGLVEWPVVLMGSFDEKFLDVPPEVIITTIKVNQKCFCVRGRDGKLANKYILVANTVPKDGGAEIIRGNNKVIAARLSDAKFFWDLDRKTKLEDLLPKLDTITFHAKLGSQGERVKRIMHFARTMASVIRSNKQDAELAAKLCKTDLVSGMVGEFPELQGLMGSYYASVEGLPTDVAGAIRDHYKPQGPSDSLPVTRTAQVVALADKLDTLVGFWAIDEKPTGSKDPFALRRAALGIIRIVLEKELRIPIFGIAEDVLTAIVTARSVDWAKLKGIADQSEQLASAFRPLDMQKAASVGVPQAIRSSNSQAADLLSFFADRLKVYLKDQGKRHDLIDAVFALGGQDDLLMIVRRVEALSTFLDTDDGKNLLAGVKRASNILKIEEKKDGKSYDGAVDAKLLSLAEEKALNASVNDATTAASAAVQAEDFAAAMKAIAKLRAPVDAFFEKVKVNDDNASIRANRLALLNRIRAATLEVADFSRIEG